MFLVFILLRFLGSVEVSGFKGNDIICDAMREVCLSFLPVLLQFVFFLFFIWKDSSLYLKIFKNIRSFWYLVKASDRWIPVLCSYDPSLLNLSLVSSFIWGGGDVISVSSCYCNDIPTETSLLFRWLQPYVSYAS